MSEFVYLYRAPTEAPLSPQQMQERMQRWQAWFKDLETKGHLANLGHPLERSGGAVVKNPKGSVTDGPYAETKDIVVGFSVIQAKDLQQAVTLATGCPIYAQSGMVEVRPLMKM
jgi:hypothetical protein